MARIRTVKPEFWDSPGIETLDPYWRLLYMAMWNWADDTGRGKAEARELMGFVFPRDEDMTVGEFRRGLGEVRRVFGVVFYKVDGRSFYAIPSWEKHQKIDKRSGARWPGPDEGELYDPATNTLLSDINEAASADPAEIPPSVRRIPGAGTGEQGNRGTGDKPRNAAPAVAAAEVLPLDVEPAPEPPRAKAPAKTAAKKPPAVEPLEQRVTAAAYERVGKAFKFVAVRGIAKWALHERGASPEAVHDALVGIHELGRPITRQTVGQWLDGHIGPNGNRVGRRDRTAEYDRLDEITRTIEAQLAGGGDPFATEIVDAELVEVPALPGGMTA